MILLKTLQIFSDQGLPPVVMSFSRRATIVHGPSDTGKSYLAKLLRFALGGKKPGLVDEAERYSGVRLTWSTGDESENRIFERRFGRNQVAYWSAASAAAANLSIASVNRSSPQRVSDVLLEAMGASAWNLIKNENGDTEKMSFLDVLNIVMATEASMVLEAPGLISDRPMTRTKERSLLRCILLGVSDPPQTAGANLKDRELSKKQRETIDDLMQVLLQELAHAPSQVETQRRLEDSRARLRALDGTLSPLRRAVDDLDSRHRAARVALNDMGERRDEIAESLSRFRMLERQYLSDLGRLDALGEGVVNLSLEKKGPCPYCGQPFAPGESTQHGHEILQRVVHEQTRVESLLSGLIATMNDLEGEAEELDDRLEATRGELQSIANQGEDLRGQIAPGWEQVLTLQEEVADLQGVATRFEQLAAISRFKSSIVTVSGQTLPDERLPALELDALARELVAVLEAWSIPGASTASLTPDRGEPVLEGKLRSSRGKGYRSILLSAQMVAVAQYCIKAGLPHPGFVVLDSPLVTYKSPKASEAEGDLVPVEVADAFYAYLNHDFLGQSIVLENISPEIELPNSKVVEFTRGPEGRYGLFPVG